MKKIIALTLAVIMMALCLTGCSPKGPSLAEVQKAGKLTVATSPDFAPYEFYALGLVFHENHPLFQIV